MNNNNSIEFNSSEDKNENPWDMARPLLNSYDHRLRNRGVKALIHRLSSKTSSPLIEIEEEEYREGFELLLERADDENYTVRTFAVTALKVVFESTKEEEQYEDVNEIAVNKIEEAMFDEDIRVLNVAIGIMGEVLSTMKEELEDLEGTEKSKLGKEIILREKKFEKAKKGRIRKLFS